MTNFNSADTNIQKNVKKVFEKKTKFNINNTDDFDKAIRHIITLLDDSFTLLKQNSYGSSVFLAITAMEETSKTHFSMYIKHDDKTKMNNDPLLNHSTKQQLSISPVFNIGSRLPDVIGHKRVEELISLVYENKGLLNLRNNAIYWNPSPDGNKFPNDYIDKNLAQEILLFAIEVFDDSIAGYSSYSIAASKHSDSLFEKIKEDYIRNKQL
ncbi:AbiV family abortive infection protein [Vagococcus fluvialis]|uniref:AbiV family abortive infection protein n=1 Tax=Vagococcus fluvialis TaxID=2738 RepID=UPI001A8D7A87|nr:AbiV family abortive infection protein [Vagococcus fluvialis]MBO0488184.1 AbiV family abortive infection protein [Vagococcus fluvialis]